MKKYDHVFILGVDGAGTFFDKADTPFTDSYMADGAKTSEMLTEIPTISAQCWGSLLLGVECEQHGLDNTYISENEYPIDAQTPSVFRVVREAMPEAELASFSCWGPINFGIIEHNLGVTFGTGDDDSIAEQIAEYLSRKAPTLLFAQFDSVDGAGHSHGYGTPEHLNRITYVDALLGKVYGAIERAGIKDDSLVMVVADHGGTPGGSHGGESDAEKYVSFFCNGDKIPECCLGKMKIRDIPSIVTYALGIEPSAEWDSEIPAALK